MKPREPEKFEVRFRPAERTVLVYRGATIMDAALLCGVRIDAPCGGEGLCGKCLVHARGALSTPTDNEKNVIQAEALDSGYRLACQATVSGPVEVETSELPSWAAAKADMVTGERLEVDLPPSITAGSDRLLGCAFDIGTTTVCGSLIDLSSGLRLSVASTENPQVSFGADVMTRIDGCRRSQDVFDRMHDSLARALNGLLGEVSEQSGRNRSDIARIVLVGNTTMVLLALGENPAPLGAYPFEPPTRGPFELTADEMGIDAAARAGVIAPMLPSGFVGADMVAAILASGVHRSRDNVMIVDLGTNGEIAIGSRGRLMSCSTAAGPAFEGALISSGMRAVPGAIESLSRDGYMTPLVLGGGEPRGICGSGLLDATAALLESGLLKSSGRLAAAGFASGELADRITEAEGMRSFILAPGTRLLLTQKDIRQVQLAKGAIRAGIEVMMDNLGLSYEDIRKVYLAGVFGNFLKPSSAVALGLFSDELSGRIDFTGNAALEGAELMLVSETRWKEALEISRGIEIAELSGNPRFEKLFIDSLSFPASTPDTRDGSVTDR